MKATTIILKDPSLFARVVEVLDSLPKDRLYECVIRPHKASLSSNQRRLHWAWMTQKSEQTGYTKEECHLDCKKRFLVPIFERDDKDYSIMIDSVRDVHRKGMPGHAQHLQKQIIKMTSITTANTKQMTEMLNEFKMDCEYCGIFLNVPDDIERY